MRHTLGNVDAYCWSGGSDVRNYNQDHTSGDNKSQPLQWPFLTHLGPSRDNLTATTSSLLPWDPATLSGNFPRHLPTPGTFSALSGPSLLVERQLPPTPALCSPLPQMLALKLLLKHFMFIFHSYTICCQNSIIKSRCSCDIIGLFPTLNTAINIPYLCFYLKPIVLSCSQNLQYSGCFAIFNLLSTLLLVLRNLQHFSKFDLSQSSPFLIKN